MVCLYVRACVDVCVCVCVCVFGEEAIGKLGTLEVVTTHLCFDDIVFVCVCGFAVI